MLDFLFILLSFFALVGAIGMISFKQPSYSALSFILTIIAIGALYALLNASFLFMVQLIVYAGAVITLLLFIIMFLNVKEENLPDEKNRFKIMFIGAIFLIPLILVVLKAMGSLDDRILSILPIEYGSIEVVGAKLFSAWIVPFELVSILLLVALIGSIVLATRKNK
ncbi:MAG: NADH-quinone oxidoreductase subunit J [Proteobacteria bacterium]|nr:MAG: NADH-quinone oxidoreductase subunit J [Pseudomonadota bacterium]